MDKVLVINPLPPYTTLCRILFLKELAAAGIQVEFWNVAHFTYGDTQASLHGEAVIPQHIFTSEAEVQIALNQEQPNNTLVVLQAWNHPTMFGISAMLKERGFITAVFWVEQLPWNRNSGFLKQVKRKLQGYKILRSLWKDLKRLCCQNNLQQKEAIIPDIVFAAGEKAVREYPWKKVIPCNYADYELWLKTRHLAVSPEYTGKCVFLDEAFCTHPDTSFIYGYDALSAEACTTYYESMNHLFDRIENELSLPVIIAAHPKSKYKGNEFGTRPIIYGHTLECMRGAKLAIAHTSTTSAQAAMYGIPIFFVKNSTTGLYGASLSSAKSLSKSLGAPFLDTDNLPSDLKQYCKINLKYYRKHLLNHMTCPKYENKLFTPDLIKFIQTLKNEC